MRSVCCLFPQRPHRPMPVYTAKRTSVLEPHLTWEPPTQPPDVTAGKHSASPLGSPAGGLIPPGAPRDARHGMTTDTPHLACPPFGSKGGPVAHLTENRSRGESLEGPQAASKAHGVGHAQARAKGPEENSHPNASNGMVQTSQIHPKTPSKRRAQIPLETGLNPRKKARWSPFPHAHKRKQGGHVGVSESPCPPARRSAGGVPAAALVTRNTPAPGQTIDLQPARTRPHLETVQACTEAPCLPSKPAPGKALRMVFMRLDKGCWSSRFLAAPSFHPPEMSALPGQGPPIVQKSFNSRFLAAPPFHPPEKSALPGQGPPIVQKLEGPFGRVPLSVLHDDLQVSSSSEDSGRE